VAGAIVLAILAAGGLYLRSRSTHPATTLTEKDTVVLADFTNSTGDQSSTAHSSRRSPSIWSSLLF